MVAALDHNERGRRVGAVMGYGRIKRPEAARLLSISQTTVDRIRKGEATVNDEQLVPLVERAGLTLDFFYVEIKPAESQPAEPDERLRRLEARVALLRLRLEQIDQALPEQIRAVLDARDRPQP